MNGDEGEAPVRFPSWERKPNRNQSDSLPKTQNFVSLPDMKPPAFNILKDDATWCASHSICAGSAVEELTDRALL